MQISLYHLEETSYSFADKTDFFLELCACDPYPIFKFYFKRH